MKNQTKNTNKIGENTNTRNFFQKTFILLAVLAFTSFGFKAKAQIYSLTVNNTVLGTCSWTIYCLDASNTVVETVNSTASSTSYSLICQNFQSIAIVDNAGNCQGYTFGSSGSFPYTAVIPTCGGGSSCSSGINCQGVANIVNCNVTPIIGDVIVTLNIN